METLVQKWQNELARRKENGLLRTLKLSDRTDFSSNDYLGLSRNPALFQQVQLACDAIESGTSLGATGSRLISGNSKVFEETEALLANVHKAENGLLFNSGYMANLAIFSCLPKKGDTILYDELIHACIKDGARLSPASRFPFAHNNLEQLESKMRKASGQIYVAVESVYSMDGDTAPLLELVALCRQHNAMLIVDEAHSSGIWGDNGSGMVCALGLENEIPIRVHTFGKAMGCHGAVVTGPNVLRSYLINFARPFIYTTAMPLHSVLSIREAYKYLSENIHLQSVIQHKISLFNQLLSDLPSKIYSNSAIQAIVIPGNKEAGKVAEELQQQGFDVRPILSPTVKEGQERIRVCLHTYNSEAEITDLCRLLQAAKLQDIS